MAASQARCLYDFDAQEGTGELAIKEGETLTITRKDVGEGWVEGTNSAGQSGLFPASYVEELGIDDTDAVWDATAASQEQGPDCSSPKQTSEVDNNAEVPQENLATEDLGADCTDEAIYETALGVNAPLLPITTDQLVDQATEQVLDQATGQVNDHSTDIAVDKALGDQDYVNDLSEHEHNNQVHEVDAKDIVQVAAQVHQQAELVEAQQGGNIMGQMPESESNEYTNISEMEGSQMGLGETEEVVLGHTSGIKSSEPRSDQMVDEEMAQTSGNNSQTPVAHKEMTSPPPAMPPPPLPAEYANTWDDPWSTDANTQPQQQQQQQTSRQPLSQQPSSNFDGDDGFDSDWDDDDSESGGNLNGQGPFGMGQANRGIKNSSSFGDVSQAGRDGRGTVKKSFNRFSTIAKTGVEDYLVGTARTSVDEKEKVYIDETSYGSQWRPYTHIFTCAISSPKKESKFKGIKSYIAYTVMPSFSNQPVTRRYKHFDWLIGQLSAKFSLIPIPPIPEKQISGRFEDDLIEYRMTMLQSWMDRICRHPIIAQCEVFHHFITCPNDEKKWKAGKRRAEQDKLVGANFYAALERPEVPLDVPTTDARIDGYHRFFSQLDEAVKLLQATCLDQTKKHQTAYKREYARISHSFSKLSRAFDMDPVNCAPGLTEAIRHVSEAYSDIGTVFEEEPKHDWDPLCHLLYEYKGMIDGYPTVINVAKGAITKRKQVEREASEGRLDHDQVPPIVRRSDTIAYALHAEVAHFHDERQRDFKKAMTSFITEQINFYQKITDRLRDSLQHFNDL